MGTKMRMRMRRGMVDVTVLGLVSALLAALGGCPGVVL